MAVRKTNEKDFETHSRHQRTSVGASGVVAQELGWTVRIVWVVIRWALGILLTPCKRGKQRARILPEQGSPCSLCHTNPLEYVN